MIAAEDAIRFVAGTVQPMAEHTFSFISSIIGIERENEGVHIGTAFRLAVGHRKALVTALHVFEDARAARLGAGYTIARGGPPARLPETPALSDVKTDLAVFFLPEAQSAVSEDAGFWPAESCDPNRMAREHDYLFLHGFPGEQARFVFGGLHRRSLPYGVMERDDDLPLDAAAHEFAMDYDPNNMRLPNGGQASLVLPPGLSGSPVWRIGAYQRDAKFWTPTDAMLVGIVSRWNHEKKVLLATNVAQLQDLLCLKHQPASPSS